VFIGNIDPFLRQIDSKEPEKLEITANQLWISIHPVVLSMIAALGFSLNPKRIIFDTPTAKSAHYLERMGLFKFLNIDSGIEITEHESAGRFIPLTRIKDSEELTDFITEIIPLLHLSPRLEHADSKQGAIVSAQYHKKVI
jgi:hypothetical protein